MFSPFKTLPHHDPQPKAMDKLVKGREAFLPITKRLLVGLSRNLNLIDLLSFDNRAAKAIFALTYKGCYRIGELVASETDKHMARIDNFKISKQIWV